MANLTAKTSSNIFYKARCEAATHNEQLSSREGAADYMSIDRGRLYRIESGIAVPYPEEIRLMADLYNAPELENYYCRTMCPLGSEIPKAELVDMDRITIRTLSTFRKIGETKEMLVSQIMDINDETIICTMPSRQGKMIVLEVGTLIEAFFYTGNYIYKSDCTVKSRGKEGNIFTVELRPETALVKFQRREFYRLKCTIDADIIPLTDEERKIFDVTGKLPDNFVMPEDKGIIVDISGGGLRLFSKKQYDADSIVNVSFPIQVGDRSRYMKLMAKVVMSMRNQNSDSVYDSRLQFVNMQKEDTEDIVKYVFAQQRMIRKKERGL